MSRPITLLLEDAVSAISQATSEDGSKYRERVATHVLKSVSYVNDDDIELLKAAIEKRVTKEGEQIPGILTEGKVIVQEKAAEAIEAANYGIEMLDVFVANIQPVKDVEGDLSRLNPVQLNQLLVIPGMAWGEVKTSMTTLGIDADRWKNQNAAVLAEKVAAAHNGTSRPIEGFGRKSDKQEIPTDPFDIAVNNIAKVLAPTPDIEAGLGSLSQLINEELTVQGAVVGLYESDIPDFKIIMASTETKPKIDDVSKPGGEYIAIVDKETEFVQQIIKIDLTPVDIAELQTVIIENVSEVSVMEERLAEMVYADIVATTKIIDALKESPRAGISDEDAVILVRFKDNWPLASEQIQQSVPEDLEETVCKLDNMAELLKGILPTGVEVTIGP